MIDLLQPRLVEREDCVCVERKNIVVGFAIVRYVEEAAAVVAIWVDEVCVLDETDEWESLIRDVRPVVRRERALEL